MGHVRVPLRAKSLIIRSREHTTKIQNEINSKIQILEQTTKSQDKPMKANTDELKLKIQKLERIVLNVMKHTSATTKKTESQTKTTTCTSETQTVSSTKQNRIISYKKNRCPIQERRIYKTKSF